MATIDLGPPTLNLENLVAASPHAVRLAILDANGDPYTPAAVTMRVWSQTGALVATVPANVTAGMAEIGLSAVTAVADSTRRTTLRHEIEVDGVSWIKGTVIVAPRSDGRGGSAPPITTATVTVNNGDSLVTVQVTGGGGSDAVATHVADTSAAHAATAIGFTPAGTVAATDVQAAIVEVSGDVSTEANARASADSALDTRLDSAEASIDALGYGRQEFNVRDYGATGDGTTDDTDAINDAITAAAVVAGTVIVPPGTYIVDFTDNSPISGQTTAILMKSGVHLCIVKGATIKLKAGATSANAQETAIIRNSGAFVSSNFDHDMLIYGGGVLDGNAANTTGVLTNGIYFGTARRCYVRDLTVKNCRATSASPPNETIHITFYRCVDYGCTDVEVFGDDGGVTATGIGSNFCSVGKFTDCNVHDLTYGAGITHYKSALVSTVNCHVYKVGGSGFLTEYSDDIDFVACYPGGQSSDMYAHANQVAPITGTTKIGCGQDTAAASGLHAGFRIDNGTRIRILGGASAYNGTDSYVASGVKIVGTCAGIEIDEVRIFGNTNGIDFTNGDGAAACVARMRATRVGRGTVLGPNKKPGGAGSNSEVLTSSGSMSVSQGEINGFLVSAHAAVAASTVAVPNPFPFDCDVVLAGGTISAVSVTPGGPAPAAATSAGLTRLVRVPHGGSITLTYSSAPTWKWFAFTGGVGDLIIGTDVQGYDADLAAIAALTTTAYGRSVLAVADAAALRTLAGSVIGTDVQGYDGDLAAIAALSTTAYGRALLELANQAALLAAVGTASATATGVVELATDAETVTGTDTTRATTPSGVAAAIAAAGGGGGGSTNLAYTAGASNGVVTSDTGTDATIPLADGTNAGLMAPAQHTKLAGIETGATADQTAAEILAALLTVDGAGSGLDADLLDGNSSAAFATAGHNHSGVYDPAGSAAAAQAASQPLDSDLTAIAALSTTSYGRAFLALADAAAGRTALGLGTAATTASTAYDPAGSAAAAQAASQPLDSDLTAIAALSTTSYGRSLLATADAAALRTLAGTVIGTDVQAHSSTLTTLASATAAGLALMDDADAAAQRTTLGLGTAATTAATAYDPAGSAAAAQAAAIAASQPLDSDLTAIAALTTTSFGRSVLALADAAALRTLAGSVIGTDVQGYDADLAAIAALSSAANKVPYATGSGTWALADLTSAGRALIDDADATAQRTTLGLGGSAVLNVGTGAGTVAAGDDVRLSDARTPTSHNHAASDVTSGTLATARLGSGTADASSFLRGDQTWAGAVQLPRFKAGWYFGGPMCTSSNTQARGTAQMTAIAVPVFKATPITQLALNVGTAASTGTLRLGVYADDGNGFPGALLAGGTTNEVITSTGVKTVTVSLTLEPGLYWFAAQQEFTGSFAVQGASNGIGSPFTYAASPGAGNNNGFVVGSVTGSLPSSWPASPATTISGNPAYVMALAA